MGLLNALIGQWLLNSLYPAWDAKYFSRLSNREKVRFLERIQKHKGYKKKCLYYRCREEGLLNEYNELYEPQSKKQIERSKPADNRARFSFGRYKGLPIDDIFKSDRSYIDWFHKQVWSYDYEWEREIIEVLYEMEAEEDKVV